MLTPTQLVTLKANIASVVDAEFVGYRNAGATGAMADWYNAAAAGPVVRWRRVGVGMLTSPGVIDLSELDGTSQGKRDALALIMQFFNGFDAATAGGNKAITDVFPNTGSPNSRAGVLAAARTNATRGEVVFGSVDLTSATPNAITAKVMNWTGTISNEDVVAALAS